MKTTVLSVGHTPTQPTSYLEPIRIERTLPTDPETVFSALTLGHKMDQWFLSRCQTDPRRFGRFELRWESVQNPAQNYSRYGEFLEFDPGNKLRFTWRGIHLDGRPTQTVVTIWLRPTPKGCSLLLIHRGWQVGAAWDGCRERHASSWTFFLDNLVRNSQKITEPNC